MRFELGKSYLSLFWGFLCVFVVLMFAPFKHSILVVVVSLPLVLSFILYVQVRSKVALDSWWKATYPAGTRTYVALMIWNTIGVVGLSVLAFLFVRHGLW